MRAPIWAAVLVVSLGLTLQATAAPVTIAASTGTTTASNVSPYYTKLSLTSILTPANSLTSFFSTQNEIAYAYPTAAAVSVPVTMKNGAPTLDYFTQFGYSRAPRSVK